MYWDAETIVAFDDLVFPNDVDEEDFRDFLDPEFYDNLLVYGPPGTGKSVLCSAIAAARTDSKTLRDLRQNIVYFDCKDKEQNKKMLRLKRLSKRESRRGRTCGHVRALS